MAFKEDICTEWTKSTLPILNPKYYWRLFDFLQKNFCQKNWKRIVKKNISKSCPASLQSPEVWGYQIFPALNMQNKKVFRKISSANGLNGLNKNLYEECRTFEKRNLALEHLFLIDMSRLSFIERKPSESPKILKT